jgi:uncharacterized repeat protein (TIGR01451 family)
VNLFQPSVTIDKTGDTLSKVTDDVTYTYTITNTSSADSPNLILDSLMDTGDNNNGAGLGDLTAYATYDTDCDELAPGDVCSFSIVYTVLAGDGDPLDNTVDVDYHPAGFPNNISDQDSHSVNLFQPAIAVAKTGDPLSKVGDPVGYTITLSNNSSADTPPLNCTATDSLLGPVFSGVLPLGNTVLNISRTVQPGDPDPLVNTVSLTCSVTGFPNVLGPITASHSTNLFQPAVEVIKSGPATAASGSTITYNFTINNLSSADSPNLILDSVTDTVLGDLTATASANGCGTLASGGSCSFTYAYTIQATDPNPLVNVVTVHYHPDGFPNDVADSDDHSLTIPNEGCTPGFWQGGAGSQLWNQVNDPQWTYGGTNPFIHTTLFNAYFNVLTDSRLNGLTMLDLVGTGGTSDSARRAARDMVAAYLNESAFPGTFPASSLANLEAMWYAAVAGGDAALDAFHNTVSAWNDPTTGSDCPLP